LTESNQIAEANLDRWAHAFGLDMLGIASMSQGQNEDALVHFKKSAALYNEIGDQIEQRADHDPHGAGICGDASGSTDEAKRFYLEAYSKSRPNKWIPSS
jgi:hypothetical protein